ncbi:MAG: T9SS type A sorting domain-containing protein [Vicingaceae bacterium]|nr:T9SS type A sorting domain-containing protein [Vicingaceae bacterium]
MKNTKLLLTLVITIFTIPTTKAQPNFDWGVSYGGTSTDYGASVAVDNSGNLVVGGTFFSPTVDVDPGPGTQNLTISGTDGYISKFDQNGNFQWVFHVNGVNSDACLMIKLDPLGNIYATGYFSGTVDFDPGPGIFNMTANGTGDAFIIKLGMNGNLIWAKQVGAIGTTVGNGIAIDNSGNVLIAGQYGSTCDFDPGPSVFNLTSAGSNDAFVMKLDANGSFLWAKSLGGSSSDYAHDIDQAGPNGIIVVGEFQGTADFNPDAGVFNLTSNGMRDGFAVMLDTNGNFVWASQYGAADNDRIFKSTSDQNGNVYLVGNFKNTVDFDPGPPVYNLSAGSSSDGFVLKLDATGNFQWAFKIGSSSVNEFTYDINYTPNSDLLVVGGFSNTIDIDPGPAIYNLVAQWGEDGYLAKYDTSGNFVYAQHFTGNSNQKAYSVSVNTSGVIAVSGHFDGTSDIDPTAGTLNVTSNGILDAFIVRLLECVNTNNTFSAFDCTIYTVPSGDETYTTIGSYQVMDTIPNACGLDSVITINLTITGPSNGTDVVTACNSYIWIDNNTYTASNNTATHTITGGAANGCDSIVTLNLTINNTATGTDVITACNSYTWIDNNTYTTSNNIATHTITNGAANGCDSIVTLNLTINNTATGTDVVTACNSYTWIDNNTYTTSNNTATHTIANGAANGCDSIVTLNLTINNTVTGTDVITACNSYTWIDNNTYTASNNTATHTITNGAANGCDSNVTLNLTINTVDNSTSTQGNDSITANATSATYQWLDCNNNYAIISGATNQLFVASANGSYAVEVTQNGCTDTSACVNVTGVGIDDRFIENTITIFPNPNNGLFTIKTPDHENQTINLLVINTLGKVIDEIYFTNKAELNLTEQAKGIYYLRLSTDNHTFVKKIVLK